MIPGDDLRFDTASLLACESDIKGKLLLAPFTLSGCTKITFLLDPSV